MRFLLLLAAALAIPASAATPAEVAGPSSATSPAADIRIFKPGLQLPSCPPTAAEVVARQVENGRSPELHKLTELPPATAYMAVERVIDQCDAPLTMIEYRSGRRAQQHGY